MRAYEFLTESAPKTVYHGSNSDFTKFDQSKSRIVNDNYGGGIAYFTDSPDIAKRYAKTMANKYGNTPVLYKVALNANNIFDVDEKFSGEVLTNIVKKVPNIEAFLRGARLLVLGADKYKLTQQLKSGDLSLTGEQVFRGLSGGMINTSMARKILQQMGYDALRYNAPGQENSSVYLAYDADDIEIISKEKS
jgi:hypothetical protein